MPIPTRISSAGEVFLNIITAIMAAVGTRDRMKAFTTTAQSPVSPGTSDIPMAMAMVAPNPAPEDMPVV